MIDGSKYKNTHRPYWVENCFSRQIRWDVEDIAQDWQILCRAKYHDDGYFILGAHPDTKGSAIAKEEDGVISVVVYKDIAPRQLALGEESNESQVKVLILDGLPGWGLKVVNEINS